MIRFVRCASSLTKLTEAYKRNPHLKELVDELKDIVKERPSSAGELMKWMKNERVQEISSQLSKELEKEDVSMMALMKEMRGQKQ